MGVNTSSLEMKLLIVLGCLMTVASGHKKLVKSAQCGPDQTTCPNGCCPVDPELNWYCCDDMCAATAADCPFVAKSEKLTKMAANKQCDPDQTSCPNGCCPVANWYCCPDNMAPGCAPTAADCPFAATREKLTKMAANKQCGPDETSCPGGCCPEANWYCCPDDWCAATAADCPFVAQYLSKLAGKKLQ